MSLLTQDDLLALASQKFEDWAVAWDKLNSWEWPAWLPDPEPPEAFTGTQSRRSDAMSWIMNRVGMRACIRHSANWLGKPEEEFNDFWRGYYEHDPDSKSRYLMREAEAAKRWRSEAGVSQKSGDQPGSEGDQGKSSNGSG